MTFAVLHSLRFDPNLLDDHYSRHKRDFGATSATDYEALARNFLTSPLTGSPVTCGACPTCSCLVYGGGRVHECVINGDTIRFDTLTTELAILGVNGFIRTYYKPTFELTKNAPLIQYFHFRCKPRT